MKRASICSRVSSGTCPECSSALMTSGSFPRGQLPLVVVGVAVPRPHHALAVEGGAAVTRGGPGLDGAARQAAVQGGGGGPDLDRLRGDLAQPDPRLSGPYLDVFKDLVA